jgi:lambda repressor-like predicted transcriptional regulator
LPAHHRQQILCESVLNLRKRGLSLRAIAEETGLGLQAGRTIVDQEDERDRTTAKYLRRVGRDMAEERLWDALNATSVSHSAAGGEQLPL